MKIGMQGIALVSVLNGIMTGCAFAAIFYTTGSILTGMVGMVPFTILGLLLMAVMIE